MFSRATFHGTIAYLGGVPTLPEPFVWAWTQMIAFNAEFLQGMRIHYDRATVSHHMTARNVLVQQMQGEWLLMLDTDHHFAPDLAYRLLHRMDELGLDVVSGLYRYKSFPHSPVAYAWGDGPKPMNARIGAWDRREPLFTVGATGGGCLLVRRRVFDRIISELGELPFDTSKEYPGEDIAFGDRCRRLGIPVWLDTRVQAQHLTWKAISEADWDPDLVPADAPTWHAAAIQPVAAPTPASGG